MTLEMPQTLEAEQALLGSILTSNSVYHAVVETLQPQHFSNALHGKMYETIGKLIAGGQQVNLFGLKTYFENDEAMKAAGGTTYMAQLLSASVHATDARSMGDSITDAAMRRQLIALAHEATTAAFHPRADQPALAQIEAFERGLYEITSTHAQGGFVPFSRNLANSITGAEAAHKRDGQLIGIATGLGSLDRLLGGLHKSDLVILAARPGMGKSALATNIAFRAAAAHRTEPGPDGKPVTTDGAIVGFFSLEMSGEQLATRILADKAGVPSDRVRRGELTSVEYDRVLQCSQHIEALPIYIDDTAALSIQALRSRARRLQRQQGLDLMVVDYLQLIGSERKDGRTQEVSEISRGLKMIAKELNIPVLALSQLNRSVEQRQDKRPQLSDLRDSGSIEQDADVVLFIYREEYYLERGPEEEKHKLAAVAGKAEVAIAKQRHGPTGLAHLQFDGPLTRFSDPDGFDARMKRSGKEGA